MTGNFLGEGVWFIEGEDLRVGAEDLLQQGCAAARVAAQKCKLIVIFTGGRRFIAPAADRLRGDGRQQIQAFALGLVIAAFQRGCVGDGSQRGLGL